MKLLLLLVLFISACGVHPSTERLQRQIKDNKRHLTDKLIGTSGKASTTTEITNTTVLQSVLVTEVETALLRLDDHTIQLQILTERIEELENTCKKKKGKGK